MAADSVPISSPLKGFRYFRMIPEFPFEKEDNPRASHFQKEDYRPIQVKFSHLYIPNGYSVKKNPPSENRINGYSSKII
jgi:hypothetical protein